jgi:hypothetical protein
VVLTNDTRVRIETADACKYPDIVAVCDAPQFYDRRRDVLMNPTLLVEVVSPSTEACDRGGKFAIYRTLPYPACASMSASPRTDSPSRSSTVNRTTAGC